MRKFASDILMGLALLINPPKPDPRPDPRVEECTFWFNLCNQEFEMFMAAHEQGDYEASKEHMKKHSLYSLRHKMAYEGYFTKP